MTSIAQSLLKLVRMDETGVVRHYLLDAGEKTNGYIELHFVNESIAQETGDQNMLQTESVVSVVYGPMENVLMFRPSLRHIRQGENLHLVCDELLSFRFISVSVTMPERMVGLEFRPLLRNQDERGSFNSNDPLLGQIWHAARRTIHLCMIPHRKSYRYRQFVSSERNQFLDSWYGKFSDWVLVDGSRRDREVWVGDLLPEVQAAWYAYADSEVIQNSLDVISCQQTEDGFLPASSVSAQSFDEYCLWFLVVLREYVLLSGDMELLDRYMQTCNKTLAYIISKTSPDGTLSMGRRQTWAWTLARYGRITSTNTVFVLALKAAADLYRWRGLLDEASDCLSRAAGISACINNEAWDEEAGAWRDCLGDSPRYSLDGNSLAVIAGIGSAVQNHRALSFIKNKLWTPYGSTLLWPQEIPDGSNWPHNEEIWPFAVQLEVEARFRAGDGPGALELMRSCWGNMLARGSSTFWEIVEGKSGAFLDRRIHEVDGADTWNSACHGWSAGVLALLASWVAGVRPLEPGFSRFIFDPQPSGLNNVSVVVPLVKGEIKIRYNYDASACMVGMVDIPAGSRMVVNVPGVSCGRSVIIPSGMEAVNVEEFEISGPRCIAFRIEEGGCST
jgi:hypothetical protein